MFASRREIFREIPEESVWKTGDQGKTERLPCCKNEWLGTAQDRASCWWTPPENRCCQRGADRLWSHQHRTRGRIAGPGSPSDWWWSRIWECQWWLVRSRPSIRIECNMGLPYSPRTPHSRKGSTTWRNLGGVPLGGRTAGGYRRLRVLEGSSGLWRPDLQQLPWVQLRLGPAPEEGFGSRSWFPFLLGEKMGVWL